MKKYMRRYPLLCCFGMFVSGAIASAISVYKLVKRHLISRRNEINSYKAYYEMMKKWIPLYQKGISVTSYFVENNYKKIAICGMGDMGVLFYDEVKESDLDISYVIRLKEGEKKIGVKICEITDNLDEVDAIVVCEIGAFDFVVDMLMEKVECPIIALDDIVYELF